MVNQVDENFPIYVREDYRTLWDTINSQRERSDPNQGGIVVIGHPGIGQSRSHPSSVLHK